MVLLDNSINIFTNLFVIMMFVGIANIVLVEQILRRKYREYWISLGEPNFLLFWKLNEHKKLAEFMDQKKYLELEDARLNFAIKLLFFIFKLSILLISIALILMLIKFVIK